MYFEVNADHKGTLLQSSCTDNVGDGGGHGGV